MKKIVYLDVDGTLLDEKNRLSDFNCSVIQAIQKKGISVALATGRNFFEIQPIAQALKIDENLNYSICQNGAYITTTDKFRPQHLSVIDVAEAQKLFRFLRAKKIFISLSSYKEQETGLTNLSVKEKKFSQNLLPPMKLTRLDANFDWSSVTMMAFESPPDETDFWEDFLKKNFQELEYLVSRSAHRTKPLFMVNAKFTSKAHAILKLNKDLKITNDNTYFFGDGINDVSAIKLFKNSFVPVSAPDYVKKVAKNLIAESSLDGVGLKLQELFL